MPKSGDVSTDIQTQLDPMASSTEAVPGGTEVWFLGPLPPPVTGMTLFTNEILEHLKLAGPVRFFNWSPGMSQRTMRMRLRRNANILLSLLKLICNGRANGKRLYLVANSKSGLLLTVLLVFASSRLGYTTYLHHHVYSYIDRYDWRMALIVRALRQNGVHVVHCAGMAQDFCHQYQADPSAFAVLSPSVPLATSESRRTSPAPFRLGMLSNLTLAKGLADAIATFVVLRNEQRNVNLTLAGPLDGIQNRQVIERAIADHPSRIKYLGPVYADKKDMFFSEIDAFLLPTRTEAWGIVLNEAIAAGVPAITYDRGCTATVIGEAGLVVDPATPFAPSAAEQIKIWMDNPEVYSAASRSAVNQAERLRQQGQQTMSQFIGHIFPDLDEAGRSRRQC